MRVSVMITAVAASIVSTSSRIFAIHALTIDVHIPRDATPVTVEFRHKGLALSEMERANHIHEIAFDTGLSIRWSWTSRALRNARRARERPDMTVPIGISNTSASS